MSSGRVMVWVPRCLSLSTFTWNLRYAAPGSRRGLRTSRTTGEFIRIASTSERARSFKRMMKRGRRPGEFTQRQQREKEKEKLRVKRLLFTYRARLNKYHPVMNRFFFFFLCT